MKRITESIRQAFRILLNQRGEVGDLNNKDDKNNSDNADLKLDENGFIPGTTFKSANDLAQGYVNLKEKFDAQGNEIGIIRKDYDGLKSQTETLATALKEKLTADNLNTSKIKSNEIDYEAEISKVEEQIQTLDPIAPDYQKTLASLVSKSNKLSAAAQHEKTMQEAGRLFKDELTERDIKSSQSKFFEMNPSFNTPEMQKQIKAYIAKDTTGMTDAISAFREIERDTIAAKAQATEAENAEMKRLLELNKGKNSAGIVVTDGQTGGAISKGSHKKVTGQDLNNGMLNALQQSRA